MKFRLKQDLRYSIIKNFSRFTHKIPDLELFEVGILGLFNSKKSRRKIVIAINPAVKIAEALIPLGIPCYAYSKGTGFQRFPTSAKFRPFENPPRAVVEFSEKHREKCRENGRKGGRPRGSKNVTAEDKAEARYFERLGLPG